MRQRDAAAALSALRCFHTRPWGARSQSLPGLTQAATPLNWSESDHHASSTLRESYWPWPLRSSSSLLLDRTLQAVEAETASSGPSLGLRLTWPLSVEPTPPVSRRCCGSRGTLPSAPPGRSRALGHDTAHVGPKAVSPSMVILSVTARNYSKERLRRVRCVPTLFGGTTRKSCCA